MAVLISDATHRRGGVTGWSKGRWVGVYTYTHAHLHTRSFGTVNAGDVAECRLIEVKEAMQRSACVKLLGYFWHAQKWTYLRLGSGSVRRGKGRGNVKVCPFLDFPKITWHAPLWPKLGRTGKICIWGGGAGGMPNRKISPPGAK